MPLYRVRRFLTVEVASTILEAENPATAIRTFESNLPENFLSRIKEHCPPGVEYVADAQEGHGAIVERYVPGNPQPVDIAYNESWEPDLLAFVYPEIIKEHTPKPKEGGDA